MTSVTSLVTVAAAVSNKIRLSETKFLRAFFLVFNYFGYHLKIQKINWCQSAQLPWSNKKDKIF